MGQQPNLANPRTAGLTLYSKCLTIKHPTSYGGSFDISTTALRTISSQFITPCMSYQLPCQDSGRRARHSPVPCPHDAILHDNRPAYNSAAPTAPVLDWSSRFQGAFSSSCSSSS
ncbi:hypothetical protein J6590_001051 [Homalodisca vitripennis]|nr:hypothetical protein J6590_001051 [Homalodisca vitripennis]